MTSTKRRPCSNPPPHFHTEETVVSTITPSVVEVPAAETTVDLSESYAVASITPTSIAIEIKEGTTTNDQTLTYTVTVNNEEVTVTGETEFVTTFTFPSTTLSLSFSSRQSAFIFSGAVSTEITIPSEHTHVTVDGIETAVDLPGLVTTIEVSDSTNVILQLPEVTTEVTVAEETYAFTWQTYQIGGEATDKSSCGTYSLTAPADSTSDYCVPGLTTTIVLPTGATQSTVYLHATGLQTAFTLPGITTTFVWGCAFKYTSRGVCHGTEVVKR